MGSVKLARVAGSLSNLIRQREMTNAKNLLQIAADSFQNVTSMSDVVEDARHLLTNCLKNKRTIFFCGNGGSAADSQHLAAEFMGRFLLERAPLPAIALTANSSSITAIANDYGYEFVFSRQLRGLGREGDVLVGISTSGNSKNVVNAFEVAQELGIATIAMTGKINSAMSTKCTLAVQVPSDSTPRIQEMHIAIGHTICQLVELDMAGHQ